MGRWNRRSFGGRFSRLAGMGLVLGAILVGTTGMDCEDAQKAILMESASSIAEGLKTIINGVIDGAVSALQSITDDSDTTSTSTGTST